MACNIPVVSTPVGNVSDMLRDVEGSYVASSFNPDELAELSDRSLSSRKINSRDSLAGKGLDIETVALRLLDLYSSDKRNICRRRWISSHHVKL